VIVQTTLNSQTKNSDCKICRAQGRETFRYMQKSYIFDIDAARVITSDGREPVELEEDDVRFSLRKCRVSRTHVRHVDPLIPGIIATVQYLKPDGNRVLGHRLIDGHHRALRCLQDGIPFQAYLMDETESARILLKAPD
jgi:hypothetical protein